MTRSRAGSLAVGVALAALAGLTSGSAGAAPSPEPLPADRLQVRVVIDSVSPPVLQPGLAIALTGHVVNDGDVPLLGVHVRPRLGSRPIDTRSGLANAMADEGPLTGYLGDVDLRTDVAAHSAVPWQAQIPADAVGRGAAGLTVYLAGAELRARLGPAAERATLARTRIPIPFLPAGARFRPTQLAVLWPVVETPPRGPSTTYLDDTLASSLSSGGRLRRLLTAGATPRRDPVGPPGSAAPSARPLPLTWVTDPALLQGATDLADGYRYLAQGKPQRGAGDSAAQAWMRTAGPVLRRARAEGRLLTLPYADPDIEALTKAGLGSDVGIALRRGAEQVSATLDVPAADSVVWPPGGWISGEGLDLLATSQVRAVLLRGDALPLREALPYTPGARATVQSAAGPMPALLTDPTLDAILAAGVPDPPVDTGLAADGEPPSGAALVQRLLAETAVITAEQPSRSRALVTAPPRYWDPSPGFLGTLLNRVGTVPWLSIVPLSTVRASEPSSAPRAPLSYPAAAQRAELSRGYLTAPRFGIVALRTRLRDLRSVLGVQADTATLPFDLALLRAESARWRTQPSTGLAVRGATAKALLADSGRVAIASKGLITLASNRGTLPITLENNLDFPVNVRLRLTTASRARLTADDTALHTVEAHRKRTLQIDAKAFTSGVFTVRAQLFTPDGDPYGDPVELRVRSTAYGAIAVAVTTGGLALLAIAIVVRLSRRLLGARRRRTTA